MTPHITCPVCASDSIEPVLDSITVSANLHGNDEPIGALMVLQCENGHIFFVRQADIELLAA